nr:hypothetical protein [Tanacetum cinerariifolium]
MDTTIDQQMARDEALVPHAKRLRIGRSNFRLLSDIKSKESTLQLVYDVLRLTLFFKAFLVTADVPKIYMQEFWATATVHHHFIRFKMDNKKHIVNLESFMEMLHICPRLPHQPFVEPPFEEEILAFLRFSGHSVVIRKLTDVEHKGTKKSNEMYYPRFTKVIIHHFMSKDHSIPRRNKVKWHYVRDDHMFSTIKLVSRHQNTQQFDALLPIELTNEDIRNSNAYKEYYAVATGATPPKPKASVRKTRSSSNTAITPPTAAAGPRLITSEKGKQAAKASKAKSDDDKGKDGDDDDGEEGDGDDDDEDDDGEEGNDDVDDQEVDRDDEKDDEEEGKNDTVKRNREMNYTETSILIKEGQSSSVSSQFVTSMLNPTHAGMESIFETTSQMDAQTPTSVAPLPMFAPTLTSSTIATITTTQQAPIPPTTAPSTLAQANNDEFVKTIDENMKKIIKKQVKEQVKTSYVVAADFSEMELKKILIEKMEGNKSIHRSNKQGNLYKPLVEAYESDKIILDTYGETVTLRRRRDDDADKDEEPSAGSDRGSKRRREGKEPESAIAPKEKATRSAGKSTQGFKSRQTSARESATAEEPIQTTFEMEEPAHPKFETGDDDQPIVESRVEDLQLGVESYQKKLNLTKPDTYRSDLKRKKAYIAYSNPRGFIYQNKDKKNMLMRIDELHKFSYETLNDVHTALDDRLKGIRMRYLPQSIWRKSNKHRAAAMIQAIDKRLKTRRIMRSLE